MKVGVLFGLLGFVLLAGDQVSQFRVVRVGEEKLVVARRVIFAASVEQNRSLLAGLYFKRRGVFPWVRGQFGFSRFPIEPSLLAVVDVGLKGLDWTFECYERQVTAAQGTIGWHSPEKSKVYKLRGN